MKLLALRTNVLSDHLEDRLPFSVYTVGTEEQKPMTRMKGYSGYQFIVTLSGKGRFRLLGQSKWDIISPSKILFIPADIPHEYISEGYGSWNVGFVSFSADAEALSAWRLGDVPQLIAVQQTDRLFELVEQIWNNSGTEHDYWRSSELFLVFLSEIAKQRYNSSDRPFLGSNTVAHAAARFLRDHVNRPETTITDLAEQLGYSRKQLTRLFVTSYHTTPLQYLKQQRLMGAARLLKAHPERTAAEISRQVGMEPVYFSRAFRSKFGVTPSEFREASHDFDLD